MAQPLRKSSEAPEVVLQGSDYTEGGDRRSIVTYAERLKRSGHGTLYAKQIDENDTESTKYPLSPSTLPPPSPIPTTLFTGEDDDRSTIPRRRGRSFGILEMMVLVLVAFLIGGGIGGGVGGALLAKEKSKQWYVKVQDCTSENKIRTNKLTSQSSANTPSATSSASAPTRTGNYIMDTAGCPAIESGGVWNSTTPGKSFQRVCYKNAVGKSNKNIITGNVTVATFDACLNACAVTNGCLAATWYMFSVTSPSKNAVCYFKSEAGVESAQPDGDALVTGYLV
jgi:hypothetical protein